MPTLHGKYKVPHFDGKGEADAIFTEAGVPTTFLLTSFYWDNFIYFGMGPTARRGREARHHHAHGRREIAGHRRGRHRPRRLRHLQEGPELIGQYVGIAGEHLTGTEMAAAFSKSLGEDVRYNSVPPEVYPHLRLPRRRRSRQHVPVQARL